MGFKDSVEKVSPKLKAITKKLNGKFTFFDEDDLYQEALLHLWQEYEKGELSDKTDSFILQGCLFFLKNYIRKACRKIDLNSISLNDIANGNEDNTDNIFENILSKEEIGRQTDSMDIDLLIEDTRGILSERERDILSLYLENLTTREIGRKLSISHTMVIKIKKRIRDKCKELVS